MAEGEKQKQKMKKKEEDEKVGLKVRQVGLTCVWLLHKGHIELLKPPAGLADIWDADPNVPCGEMKLISPPGGSVRSKLFLGFLVLTKAQRFSVPVVERQVLVRLRAPVTERGSEFKSPRGP